MKIKLFFRWYDLWIGGFIDSAKKAVYIVPFPMFGVKISWQKNEVSKPPCELIEFHRYECEHVVGKPAPDECPICKAEELEELYEDLKREQDRWNETNEYLFGLAQDRYYEIVNLNSQIRRLENNR